MPSADQYDNYDDEIVIYEDERNLPRAVDWGTKGGILTIIILTLLYAIFPIDLVPDLIPVAGQADDLAAIVAGGGSVTLLAALRVVWHSRFARWSCLVLIALSAIGTLTVIVALIRLIDSIF
jgi:hypothetical protein